MPKFNTKLSRREKRYLQTLKRLLFVRYRTISKLAIPLVIVAFFTYIISAFMADDKIHSLIKDIILAVAGGLTLALVYWRTRNDHLRLKKDSEKLDLEIEKADNDRKKLNQEISKNIKDRFNDALKNLSDKDNVGIRMHGVIILINFIKEAYKDYGTDKYENNLYKDYGKNSFDILIYHLQKLSNEHKEAFEKHQKEVVLKNMNEQFKDEIDKPFELTDIPLLFGKYSENRNKFIEAYKRQTWNFSMSLEIQEVINLLFGDEVLSNVRKSIREQYQLKYYPTLQKIHLTNNKAKITLYLDSIDFKSANFTCSNLYTPIFQNSNLDGASFNSCQFWDCSFENSDLLGTLFINSILSNANFKGGYFSLADFSYSLLNPILNFSTGNFVSNKFQNVDITEIVNEELKENNNTDTRKILNTLINARFAVKNGAILKRIEIPNLANLQNDFFYYKMHESNTERGKYAYELKIKSLPTKPNSDANERLKYLEEILYETGFYTDEMEKDGRINPRFI